MQFEHGRVLWSLVLCLLPIGRWLRGARTALDYPPAEGLCGRAGGRARALFVIPCLQCLVLGLLVVAAAGPHLDSRPLVDPARAGNVIVAIDTSESMAAMDFGGGDRPLSRWQGAARLAAGFLRRAEGVRVGVVGFGGRATTQCPLTFDRETAVWLLDQLSPNVLGRRTALGEAVALSAGRLEETGGAIVLLSDGQDTAGPVAPEQAAEAARQRGVRLYVVGIGSDGPVPTPVRLPSGRTVLRRKDYPLNETVLKQMVRITGGRYFRATDRNALGEVLETIRGLEERPAARLAREPVFRIDHWFLWGAGAGIFLLMLTSGVWLRTAPVLR